MDEAQTGFGRLGTMFGFEHDGVVPDFVGVSKTLGGGLPLAATITSSAIEQDCYEKGFLHVTSHVSDPLPASAGLAVLDVIAEEGLVERAAARGEYMLARLRELQTEHEPIGDVRGRGLLIGLELVEDRETQEPRRRARRRGHAGVLRARPVHEHRPLPGPCELLPHRPAADRDGGRDRPRSRDHGRFFAGGARARGRLVVRRCGYGVGPSCRRGDVEGRKLRMGSSSKRQTTMAKIARERKLQEKRERKQEKKEARKQAAADERAGVNGEAAETDETEEAEVSAEPSEDEPGS